MPYKVKATIVNFLGDTERYPCHMNYKIGDEIIFDGEKFIGRICPHILAPLATKVHDLVCAGPRYVDPGYYNLFWYSPPSVVDLSKKKYDGNGFSPVLKTLEEPPHSLAALVPPHASEWPPLEDRTICSDVTLVCPDTRTSVVIKLEAVDLCEFGEAAPYFRREMTVIFRLSKNPGMTKEEILDDYTEEQRMSIYPPLIPNMLSYMIEELESVKYVYEESGRYYATDAAKVRLSQFISSITEEEVDALQLR